MKEKILITAYNTSNLFDLFDSKLIDHLKKKYELEFLIEKKYEFENYPYKENYQEKLKEFKVSYIEHFKNNKFKNKIEKFLFRINFYSTQIKQFNKLKRYKNNKYSVLATLVIDDPKYINFFLTLLNFKIFPLFSLIINKVYNLLNLKRSFFLKDEKYKLILIAWKISPFSNFYEKIIREAKIKQISTLGIQLNWDNVVNRYTNIIPDFVSVIGHQTFDYLFTNYNISPHRIFVNGSLKIQSLKNASKTKKLEALKLLKLPENKSVICYAPSGEDFDNIYILKTLNDLMFEKDIFENFIFYVKGYSGGRLTTLKKSFFNEHNKKNFELDTSNLIFWEPSELKMSQKDYFTNLYSSVDGIISNYSSVVLEGAFFNIPFIGLHYNPKEYGLCIKNNWMFKNFWPHSYTFRKQVHIQKTEIKNREEMKFKIRKFCEFLRCNKNFSEYYKNISLISLNNTSSVVHNISNTIDFLISKNEKKISTYEKNIFDNE